MQILFLPRFENIFLRWGLRLIGGILLLALLVVGFVFASIPWALLAGFDPGTRGVSADRVIFTNVNVLPMTGEGYLTNRHVVIEDGRILSVSQAVPDNLDTYTVIDGQGRTLMPGLIDMHVHVFDRTDMLNYLTHGVTGVRNMMGMPLHLRLRDEVESGRLPGPRMITATPTFNQGEWAPFHRFVESPEEARDLVGAYVAHGYDFVKIYTGLQPDVFQAIMEAAREEGVAVTGHQPIALDIRTFLQAGVASVEHAEDVYNGPLGRSGEPDDIATVRNNFQSNRSPLTPTLMAYRNLQLANADTEGFFASVDMDRINPVVQFFGHRGTAGIIEYGDPERIDRKLGIMMMMTRQLYQRRGGIILGTDTGPAFTVPGHTLHEEIALISSMDIDPYEILYSGTVAPAQVWGLEGELGIVSEGALADLILVEDNPLENLDTLRMPDTVISSGRLYQSDDLQILRDRGTATMSTYATVGWMIWHELMK